MGSYLLSLVGTLIIGSLIHSTATSQQVISHTPVTRLYRSGEHACSDSMVNVVRRLFRLNDISLENLRISTCEVEPSIRRHHIRCEQFLDGLEVFRADITYHFQDDSLYSVNGERIPTLEVDTIPQVSMSNACIRFCNTIATDTRNADSLKGFQDKGFTAELGFLDVPVKGQYVLMWRLRVKGGFKYPFSYIRADSIAAPWYDNGMVKY